MPSRDVNAATRLAEASWRRDKKKNGMKSSKSRKVFTKVKFSMNSRGQIVVLPGNTNVKLAGKLIKLKYAKYIFRHLDIY